MMCIKWSKITNIQKNIVGELTSIKMDGVPLGRHYYGIIRTDVLLSNGWGWSEIYRRIEDVKEQIVLFRPVYSDDGNTTELIFMAGEKMERTMDRRNIASVRMSLARSYNLDLSAQSRELEQRLNRRYLLPFYLPDGRVFVPLKMRRPQVIGDNTYGYVDVTYIKYVRKVNGQTMLKLTAGEDLPLSCNSTAAYSSISLGKDTLEYLNSRVQDEQEKVLDALGILINKLYRIEKILDKF